VLWVRTRSWLRAPALVAGALACAAAGFAVYGLATASGAGPPTEELILGHSVKGRPINAYVVGDPSVFRSVLVVGCIHGDEPAGEAVTRALRRKLPPRGVKLWLVDQFNPDGCIAHTRQNADGVDLNRNSPWHWRPLDHPGGTFYSGPRPLSEPESRTINRFIRQTRPAVTIWYHQHAALVDDGSGGSIALERRYATISGLPLRNYGVRPGSIISWQDSTFPADTAFDVELPSGPLSKAEVDRHVAAVLALARLVARG
jgi:protein MpaA